MGLAPSADAAFIERVDGSNDCPNVYGTTGGGFDSCVYEDSPIIIKFDDEGDVDEINGIFETIDGSEFEFTFNYNDENEVISGMWWYTPSDFADPEDEDASFDPLITYYMAKGGGGWNIFSADNTVCELGDATQCGSFYIDNYGSLSHLSFYDNLDGENGGSPPLQIPEPGVLLLMGAGLLGLGMARRRKPA